jgi:phospholipase/lecithinase/hemolysin
MRGSHGMLAQIMAVSHGLPGILHSTGKDTSMQFTRALTAASLIVLSFGYGAAHAGPFTSLVVFGDSLSDVGNVFIATGGAMPPSPPYAPGRFSNGPIWIDDLAAGLGLASPNPALLPGGTDFAFGGAESGSGFTAAGVPNLETQVGAYLSSLAGGAADPGALYVLWAGSNDYLDGQTNPSIPPSNVAAAVAALAADGARQFIVPNLPPLGEIPQSIANLNPADRAALDTLSEENNQLLGLKLDALASALSLTIYQPDIHGLYLEIQAHPAAFGFTNVTSGALLDSNPGAVGYLFWDGLHPTAAGQELIAERALETIPEPSTFVLSSILFGIFGAVSSYKRFKQSTAA